MQVHNSRGRSHFCPGKDFASQTAPMKMLARFRPDEFTLAMAATVTIALVLPCYDAGAQLFAALTSVAIGLLFFLQGARLSRAAIVAGASHWRLHLVIFAASFVLFPLAGLALRSLASALLAPQMVLGLIFLCTLPSTVQASVAFTSIAGGNVAAALCSASASSLVGMAATRCWPAFYCKRMVDFRSMRCARSPSSCWRRLSPARHCSDGSAVLCSAIESCWAWSIAARCC